MVAPLFPSVERALVFLVSFIYLSTLDVCKEISPVIGKIPDVCMEVWPVVEKFPSVPVTKEFPSVPIIEKFPSFPIIENFPSISVLVKFPNVYREISLHPPTHSVT